MKAEMPPVSVIIPTYNQAFYLEDAINSVLNQTYQDFEIIVVDDGSTDATNEVVLKIQDTRIRYIYQENRGLSGARNTGIRNSQSLYISFLDSDDRYLPENLALLMDVFKHQPEYSWVAGQTIPIDEKGAQIASASTKSAVSLQDKLLFGNPFPVGTMMIRRSCFEKVGYFDESLRAYEDWDLWLRFAKAGCKFTSIEQPVFLYRYHRDQMTREGDRMRIATFKVLEKVYKNPDALPPSWVARHDQAFAYAHLRSAGHYYRAEDYGPAIKELEEAVRLYPNLIADNAKILTLQFQAWAFDPRNNDPIGSLECIYDHLPESLGTISRSQRQHIGRAAIQLAFETYQYGDYSKTCYALIRAFKYQPRWLLNRGALVILWRSWIKSFLNVFHSNPLLS